MYREHRQWFSRYEPHFVRFYSKTVFIGVRVANRIEKTDFISASFMMLCLISIVVYGNADLEKTDLFI
jgi:hypothetical protein